MKFTFLTPALAAILGLALASAPVNTIQAQTTNTATSTPAATKPSKPKSNKIPYKGTLTAIDTTGNTITVSTSTKDSTKTLTLVIGPKTIIQKDKKTDTFSDFAVGDMVSGSYMKDAATGTMTAASLHKFTPKAAAAPAAAKPAPAATN